MANEVSHVMADVWRREQKILSTLNKNLTCQTTHSYSQG